MIVVIQDTEALLSFYRHFNCRSIREIDIGPPVAVIVDQDDSAAHGLDDVALGRIGGMTKGNARRSGDVFKLRYRASTALSCLSRRRGRRGDGVTTLRGGERPCTTGSDDQFEYVVRSRRAQMGPIFWLCG